MTQTSVAWKEVKSSPPPGLTSEHPNWTAEIQAPAHWISNGVSPNCHRVWGPPESKRDAQTLVAWKVRP